MIAFQDASCELLFTRFICIAVTWRFWPQYHRKNLLHVSIASHVSTYCQTSMVSAKAL